MCLYVFTPALKAPQKRANQSIAEFWVCSDFGVRSVALNLVLRKCPKHAHLGLRKRVFSTSGNDIIGLFTPQVLYLTLICSLLDCSMHL
jgi:hypothetical protein